MGTSSIGRIISIDTYKIIAELYDSVNNYISTIDEIRFIGEIGSYVSINEIDRKIIAEIVSVEEKNLFTNKELSKPNGTRLVALSLIGEITDDSFCFGVSKPPHIYSEISIIHQSDLQVMLDVGESEEEIVEGVNTRLRSLRIGQSVVFPDYPVYINIDRIFGFHLAVFGNTGAGKSNTIARIIQNIFLKREYSAKGAKFIIFDSNGEYNRAFESINEFNADIKCKCFSCDTETENHLEIPVWALSADDWAILLHASEKTQIPVLYRAMDIAKVFYDPDCNDDEVKNHILASTVLGILNSSDSSPSKADKIRAILAQFATNEFKLTKTVDEVHKQLNQLLEVSYGEMKLQQALINYCDQFIKSDVDNNLGIKKLVPFDLKQFSEAVKFATLYEGSISSQRIQEYTSTLLTRLQAIIEGSQGKLFTKTEYTSINDYIKSLIGDNQILDIDISMLDDSSSEVIAKVLSKIILDYVRKLKQKAEMPINLIVEEAHRFVKNDGNNNSFGFNVFERIAKEGRKYGLLMGISSQRPSELSKTVVSQCSNFIIHRVQNPDDLQYISKMVPYINRGILDRLTYLQTGTALVFGTAINLPTLTRFAIASPETDSNSARISEKWFVE